jgi:hypothetical protein
MKDHRIKSGTKRIAKALEGDYRPEHLFALKQALELYDTYRNKIEACDREIDKCLARFNSKIDSDQATGAKLNRKNKNQPTFDLSSHLYRITGVDFTAIDGFDVLTAQTIISEVGLDPSKFPTEKHFSSWLCLCPDNRITGGRIKSSKTRKNANRAANAFRLSAQSLTRSPSAAGAFYRRMRARLGAPQANTATAHKLARIFYYMWKNGVPYHDKGANYYEQTYRDRVLRNMKKKARALGYNINLEPIPKQEVIANTERTREIHIFMLFLLLSQKLKASFQTCNSPPVPFGGSGFVVDYVPSAGLCEHCAIVIRQKKVTKSLY